MTARVVLIDSGVNAHHPHLRDAHVVIDSRITTEGRIESCSEQRDHLGHGTAAAAAIVHLAPDVEVVSIQVFDERPSCPFAHVLTALDRALTLSPQLVNLSLGTTNREWCEPLEAILARATELGVTLVAPATAGGLPSYPGTLSGVAGVLQDARLARELPEWRVHGTHRFWYASPYPRDLPDLPRAANLAGPSMASANVTGHLARLLRGHEEAAREQVGDRLLDQPW